MVLLELERNRNFVEFKGSKEKTVRIYFIASCAKEGRGQGGTWVLVIFHYHPEYIFIQFDFGCF